MINMIRNDPTSKFLNYWNKWWTRLYDLELILIKLKSLNKNYICAFKANQNRISFIWSSQCRFKDICKIYFRCPLVLEVGSVASLESSRRHQGTCLSTLRVFDLAINLFIFSWFDNAYSCTFYFPVFIIYHLFIIFIF